MNRNELEPDNDSTGKLQQSHVIDSLLFKANEKFAEAIEKGVRDLNAPAACVEVRVALQLLFLLAWGGGYVEYNRAVLPHFHSQYSPRPSTDSVDAAHPVLGAALPCDPEFLLTI